MAFLHDCQPLEGANEVRVYRKQADEVLKPLVHPPVEPGEWLQVLGDPCPLLVGFPQQTLGDDMLDVLPGDAELVEPVLHPAHAARHMLESGAVEYRFLNTRDEAEPKILADLADLAEECQILNQLTVVTASQVVEEFVHDQEQPSLRIAAVERRHHVLERALVVRDLVGGRKAETTLHSPIVERVLKGGTDECPQVHGCGPQLRPGDLESACNGPHCLTDPGVDLVCQLLALGNGRNHRHQVGLAGSIIAHNEQAPVVCRLVKAQLRDRETGEPFGHLVADDVGGYQSAGGLHFVGVS